MAIKIDTDAISRQLEKIKNTISEVKKNSKKGSKEKANHDMKSFHEFDNNFNVALKILDSYQNSSSKDLATLTKNAKVIKKVDETVGGLLKNGRPIGR